MKRTGFYFVHIFPVPSIPGLAFIAPVPIVRHDFEYFSDVLFIDHIPQSDLTDIGRGNHDGHAALNDFENIKILFFSVDDTAFHGINPADTMRRVDRQVTDTKSSGSVTVLIIRGGCFFIHYLHRS